mgnify:CR=1 FL=1
MNEVPSLAVVKRAFVRYFTQEVSRNEHACNLSWDQFKAMLLQEMRSAVVHRRPSAFDSDREPTR